LLLIAGTDVKPYGKQGTRTAAIWMATRFARIVTAELQEAFEFHYEMPFIINQHDGWTSPGGAGFLGLSNGWTDPVTNECEIISALMIRSDTHG